MQQYINLWQSEKGKYSTMEAEICNTLEEAKAQYKEFEGVVPYIKTVIMPGEVKEINIEEILEQERIETRKQEEDSRKYPCICNGAGCGAC